MCFFFLHSYTGGRDPSVSSSYHLEGGQKAGVLSTYWNVKHHARCEFFYGLWTLRPSSCPKRCLEGGDAHYGYFLWAHCRIIQRHFMGVSWATIGLSMGYAFGQQPWATTQTSWATHGLRMGCSWSTRRLSRKPHRLSMGYAWVTDGLSMGYHYKPSWTIHGLPMGFPWAITT